MSLGSATLGAAASRGWSLSIAGGLDVIIAIDARPLVTRHIAGAEQHARNIVAAWASMDTPHRFVLMLSPQWQNLPDYDPGLIQQLPQDLFSIYLPVAGESR